MIHFVITNRGTEPLHVQMLSRDTDGRFTHAYAIEVEGGHSKSFSSAVPGAFMIHEGSPGHGVLLPRGVPPRDVEKPADVPVDPAASAEVSQVATVADPTAEPDAPAAE